MIKRTMPSVKMPANIAGMLDRGRHGLTADSRDIGAGADTVRALGCRDDVRIRLPPVMML
jgi:hypothetical protein